MIVLSTVLFICSCRTEKNAGKALVRHDKIRRLSQITWRQAVDRLILRLPNSVVVDVSREITTDTIVRKSMQHTDPEQALRLLGLFSLTDSSDPILILIPSIDLEALAQNMRKTAGVDSAVVKPNELESFATRIKAVHTLRTAADKRLIRILAARYIARSIRAIEQRMKQDFFSKATIVIAPNDVFPGRPMSLTVIFPDGGYGWPISSPPAANHASSDFRASETLHSVPLRDAIGRIAERGSLQVFVSDEVSNDKKATVVRRHAEPRQLLNAIATAFDLIVKPHKNGWIVRSARDMKPDYLTRRVRIQAHNQANASIAEFLDSLPLALREHVTAGRSVRIESLPEASRRLVYAATKTKLLAEEIATAVLREGIDGGRLTFQTYWEVPRYTVFGTAIPLDDLKPFIEKARTCSRLVSDEVTQAARARRRGTPDRRASRAGQ